MAGLGINAGLFLGGLGQGFVNQRNQQQELQLRQQHEQNQQKRELYAKADKQRAELWGIIDKTISMGYAAGNDDAAVTKAIGPLVDHLSTFSKQMGSDPTLLPAMVATTIANAKSANSVYKQAFDGDGGQQPRQPAQQAQAAPQQPPGPVPFMQAGGQPSADPGGGITPKPDKMNFGAPEGGQQTPDQAGFTAAAPQAAPPPVDPAKFGQKVNRLMQAMQVADQADNKAVYARAKAQLDAEIRKHNEKATPIHHKDPATGEDHLYLLNQQDPSNPQMMEVPFPESKAEEGALPEQSSSVKEGKLKPLSDKQLRALDAAGMTPEQFDYEAEMQAYGNTVNLGSGRDKATMMVKRMLNGRAVDFWEQKYHLSPEQANKVQVRFAGMRKGAATIQNLSARMDFALERAKATAPVVHDISKQIDRTQYPSLNSLILAAKKGTGDEKVVRLQVALETLASNYGTSLGMGNSVLTDYQTKRAQELLDKGYSAGQLDAVADQMLIEIEREKAASKSALEEFMGEDAEQLGAPAAAAGGQKHFKYNPETGELE